MDAAGRVHQINSGAVEQESTSDVVAGPSLPTAFLLCIAIGVYLTLMLVALVVRKCANKKELHCCEKAACPCSAFPTCPSLMDCCSWLNGRFADASLLLQCNCAKHISSIRCPDTCCGMTADRCSSCLAPSSLFNCGRCDCTCSCRLPECQSINCCCFEIHIKK